jgi:hypothetical protein
MFGYEQGSSDLMEVSLAQDFRALLPPEEYFRLFRLCCTKIASLNKEMLSTFLPPSFYAFLTLLKKNEEATPRRKLPYNDPDCQGRKFLVSKRILLS